MRFDIRSSSVCDVDMLLDDAKKRHEQTGKALALAIQQVQSEKPPGDLWLWDRSNPEKIAEHAEKMGEYSARQ